jgi:hypothetical protein
MRRARHEPSIAGHGLAVNLVLLLLLGLFAVICATGAYAGFDGVRKHEPVDFMSPAWFVAGALGVVGCAGIMVALVVSMISDAVAKMRKSRRKGAQPQ